MGVTNIRLARFGHRNNPFFRLVAIDSRKKLSAGPIEYLGTYNPLPYSLDSTKEVRLCVDRIKYWLGVGAQPSERVAYLLWRAGLMPEPPIRFQTKASVSKQKVEGAEGGGGGVGGGGRGGAAAAGGKAKGFHTLTDAAAVAGGARGFRGLLASPRLGFFGGLHNGAPAPLLVYPLSVSAQRH